MIAVVEGTQGKFGVKKLCVVIVIVLEVLLVSVGK